MFVVPCKYRPDHNYITELVPQIRKFHPNEKIVVVDSDSEDKGYFEKIKPYDVIMEDIANHNWGPGAYWHCYKKWPNEDYYFFIHDSMKVKANMDYLKNRPLVVLAYFNRQANPSFGSWRDRINAETKYTYAEAGCGCYGISFFCMPGVMEKMQRAGVDKLLPANKAETGYLEGAYGFFFEQQGYKLQNCALYGDILHEESPAGRSGPYPHKTDWQYPIEKFYAFHQGRIQ